MKLSLYSGNLCTYYPSITLMERKNSCTSLIIIIHLCTPFHLSLINYLTFAEARKQRIVTRNLELAEARTKMYQDENIKLKEQLDRASRLQKAKEAKEAFTKRNQAAQSRPDHFEALAAVRTSRSYDALVDRPLRVQSALRTINEHPYLVSCRFHFTNRTKNWFRIKVGLKTPFWKGNTFWKRKQHLKRKHLFEKETSFETIWKKGFFFKVFFFFFLEKVIH